MVLGRQRVQGSCYSIARRPGGLAETQLEHFHLVFMFLERPCDQRGLGAQGGEGIEAEFSRMLNSCSHQKFKFLKQFEEEIPSPFPHPMKSKPLSRAKLSMKQDSGPRLNKKGFFFFFLRHEIYFIDSCRHGPLLSPPPAQVSVKPKCCRWFQFSYKVTQPQLITLALSRGRCPQLTAALGSLAWEIFELHWIKSREQSKHTKGCFRGQGLQELSLRSK